MSLKHYVEKSEFIKETVVEQSLSEYSDDDTLERIKLDIGATSHRLNLCNPPKTPSRAFQQMTQPEAIDRAVFAGCVPVRSTNEQE